MKAEKCLDFLFVRLNLLIMFSILAALLIFWFDFNAFWADFFAGFDGLLKKEWPLVTTLLMYICNCDRYGDLVFFF